jgi:hypothetical protein
MTGRCDDARPLAQATMSDFRNFRVLLAEPAIGDLSARIRKRHERIRRGPSPSCSVAGIRRLLVQLDANLREFRRQSRVGAASA